MSNNWICAQYGAREYYAVPRGLQKLNCLDKVYTDIWCENKILQKLVPKFKTRFHKDLKGLVYHSSIKSIYHLKAGNSEQEFDNYVASKLKQQQLNNKNFFTYSYGSYEKIKAAKEQGANIIYGQINPGPLEAEIVKKLYRDNFPGLVPNIPSEVYWKEWKKEVDLIDTMVVNSEWSKKLLVDYGIPSNKIKVIPLTFEKSTSRVDQKNYPEAFTKIRRLKVLYLGSLSVRKGFHLLPKTFESLKDEPIQLDVVGRINGPFSPEEWPKNMRYHGAVSPTEIDDYLKNADVFILPTYSDGFALTQLEAQAYKLPIITTPFCGQVVNNNTNGLILNELSAETIAEALLDIAKYPEKLKLMASNTSLSDSFKLENIAKQYQNININR